MLRSHYCLRFSAAQVGAACLTLAINIAKHESLASIYNVSCINDMTCLDQRPFAPWKTEVLISTRLAIDQDLEPAYNALVRHVCCSDLAKAKIPKNYEKMTRTLSHMVAIRGPRGCCVSGEGNHKNAVSMSGSAEKT